MKKFSGYLPFIVLVCAVAWVCSTLIPPRNSGDFDLAAFGKLPVLANGRIKPMDTLARSSLLQLQERQTIYLNEKGDSVSPDEWLLDVFFRPEKADTYQAFLIDNPDVLSLFNLRPEDGFGKRRFSFNQLAPHLDELERQAKLADPVENAVRTSFQSAVMQLFGNLQLYNELKFTLVSPDSQNFLGELLEFQKIAVAGRNAVAAKEAGRPHDEALAQKTLEYGRRFAEMGDESKVLSIPPDDPAGNPNGWTNTGKALLATFQTGSVDATALAYSGMAYAWREGNADQFNHILALYRDTLTPRFRAELRKANTEWRFNAAAPFGTGMYLYVAAFLLAVISWLKFPEVLGRIAFWLVALAWVVTTAGILSRMWVQGRPPVTNLYSSALFVGWGAVTLCLVLEWIYRNAIGSAAAGLVGLGALVIAHHLSLSGDTLEMMQAVLDSNFWLSTHVVIVSTGYASTFLAGFLAIIYVLRGSLTRSLDKGTADALAKMVYGIICFATLFSFTGTVLGGIWADQSWGRFWGWDPKENGALIIVLWNALILHARWGGMVRQRGLMCLAVFGNVVTAWSWFGTNLLGVGLHSYGFTKSGFWWLMAFDLSQLAIIALAMMPVEKWRSFRAKPAV